MCSINTGVLQISPSFSISADVFSDSDCPVSLIGLGPLANRDCRIEMNKHSIVITARDGEVLIKSAKMPTDRLWPIDLDNPCMAIDSLYGDNIFLPHEASVCNLSISNTTHAEIVKHCSATMGYIADSTLLYALRQQLLIFPGITADMVAKNLPHDITTYHGHFNANRSGVNSRRRPPPRVPLVPTIISPFSKEIPIDSPTYDDTYLDDDDDFVKDEGSITIFTKVLPFNMVPERVQNWLIAQSDATGGFPLESHDGFMYVLISIYRNYIKYTAMRSRSAKSYRDAFKSMIDYFSRHGHRVPIIRMDNETSGLLKEYFATEKIVWQFVPAGDHRTNQAERAIQTAKNHLISMLSGAHESFPLDCWVEALPHAECTLNQLRRSLDNPNMSAWTDIRGPYDHFANPLSIFGTVVLAHDSAEIRKSWDKHGTRGFYVGNAPAHYRCHRVLTPDTRRVRISNNLAWFHDKIIFPGSSIGG